VPPFNYVNFRKKVAVADRRSTKREDGWEAAIIDVLLTGNSAIELNNYNSSRKACSLYSSFSKFSHLISASHAAASLGLKIFK
jgi:hypothetical protein